MQKIKDVYHKFYKTWLYIFVVPIIASLLITSNNKYLFCLRKAIHQKSFFHKPIMSMIPFFPSLRPQIANRIWFEINTPPSEDDVLRYERDHDNWKESIKNAASDIPPLGKVLTRPGPETDDEDANDDSDDSDTHDDDDDTNDRAIPGQPEHSALYSPGDDANPINEDIPTTVDTL